VAQARKLRRAAERREDDGKPKKKVLVTDRVEQKPVEVPDPLKTPAFRQQLIRLALVLVGIWIVGLGIASLTQGIARTVAWGVPAVVSLVIVGALLYTIRQTRHARGVVDILSKVSSAEDRKAALAELESTYKKSDPAAVFARAQLELQEDPKKALKTLEQIDLAKTAAPVADEARAQRSMILLMMGDVAEARELVDGIELKRHQDPKSRAMMAAVIGEAWARSGQSKKALDTLGVIDPEDSEYEQLRPQLHRALAYAHAHTGDTKAMRRYLKKLADQDMRLLLGFMAKRTHPLLQKEAKRMLEQSGQLPRKMVVQRRP